MIDLGLRVRTDSGCLLVNSRTRAGGLQRLAAGSAAVCVTLLPCLSLADDIGYSYDAVGRLTAVTVAGNTAYYDYDAAGNITAIRRQGSVTATRADEASHATSAQMSAE